MGIKRGYKQTEVGIIPEDWDVCKLGKYVAFKTGPFGSTLHKSDYVDGGVPVINPMQIVNGKIQPTQSMAITEQAALHLSDFRLSTGNLIIGRRGEMGRCALVGEAEHGWLCGTGSMVIRTTSSIDGGYLQRVLSSPPIIAAIESTSVGSTMINLNQGTLGNLIIALPPEAEQEAIAEALDAADALLEALEQLLVKKRHIKQGAMQELLRPKEDWVATNFGTIVDQIVGGGTPSRGVTHYWNGTIPWMTVKDFANHNPSGTIEYITQEGLKNSASNLIPKGTVVTSTRMALGKAVVFDVDVAINQDLKAIFPTRDINTSFLLYWFQFNEQRIADMGSGSTVMGISLSDLRAVPFAKPTLLEQTAIAEVLSDMDAEIAALEAQLAKAQLVKQGMMQELLSGRIRLV